MPFIVYERRIIRMQKHKRCEIGDNEINTSGEIRDDKMEEDKTHIQKNTKYI